jgi:hypothetical protein
MRQLALFTQRPDESVAMSVTRLRFHFTDITVADITPPKD